MFTANDLKQLREKGISREKVYDQIKHFKSGFPKLEIKDAATPENGIIRLDKEKTNYFNRIYNNKKDVDLLKFVPASGAASRMFKDLLEFYTEISREGSEPVSSMNNSVLEFFNSISRFEFYDDLEKVADKHDTSVSDLIHKGKYTEILEYLLFDKGLNYGSLPKGLLNFHRYSDGTRTAFEEHLAEGALYAKNRNNTVKIHMTVSPEHLELFKSLYDRVKEKYQEEYEVQFEISFSVQKPSTDTIAVTPENELFHTEDGSLLFRPGGHGALLDNLCDMDAEIIFIKNIDNVVPDNLKPTTILYKKVLAGILMFYKQEIDAFLKQLNMSTTDRGILDKIKWFLENELCVLPGSNSFNNEDQLIEYLKRKLNRPIRVCGMVKNEGEPGGGPFWAVNPDGTISLQIVETTQIDMNRTDQKEIHDSSTHFNPVDIICSVYDYKGEKFDLLQYRDPATGFISNKSKDGRELKALELPGLWNGAMSDWNTIFVEVPIETFNPVKTVNDLLRQTHQG